MAQLPPRQPKSWLQLHLLTCLAMMLVAGIYVGIFVGQIELDPVPWLREYVIAKWRADAWRRIVFLWTVLSFVIVLAFTALISEWLIRRKRLRNSERAGKDHLS